MQAKYKWLLLPPALALVLFLGPLRDAGNPAPARTNPTTTEATRSPVANNVPALPGMWQVASTLVGVLLLGGVAVVLLKRARFNRPIGDGTFCVLRQSLQLSQRHIVHAVEFEGELLLLGECDGNLSVMRSGDAPVIASDEQNVTSRTIDDYDDDDDGAVPRDMVIPRPPRQPRQVPASKPKSKPAPQVAAKLANFKSLLAKAGAGR